MYRPSMQCGGGSAPATWIETFRGVVVPAQSGETNMTSKSKIAALAALITIVAAPAFAGDQDTATELRDSGRYVPELVTPVRPSTFGGAYASAVDHTRVRSKQGESSIPSVGNDFQLQGR
jgi:hypothetical protein